MAKLCTLEAIASADNLLLAAANARRGKSRRPDVEDWWLRRETEVLRLREELLSGAYQPGAYRFFEIHDPKRRMIAAAPFRDRVVHHALCHLMAPVLERRFIARSFSCQLGKGTTAARECCRQLTNRFAYVLKCDVRKFFPSIDHGILREKLARQIRCPGVLNLTDKIIGSHQTEGSGTGILPVQFGSRTIKHDRQDACPTFPSDDLVAVMQRPRGLPIGNLTSQFWGNFYLDAMDHHLTEGEQHGAYLRYTDDFLLFGDDKARLWELREIIVGQLATVRLKLAEPKSRLLTTREGVPFCGFRFLPELRPRILGATKRRFERRRYSIFRSSRREEALTYFHFPLSAFRFSSLSLLTSAATNPLARLTVSIFAWYQFSREGNSEGLRRAYVRWPLAARLKRRQRRTSRVLRVASWSPPKPVTDRRSGRRHLTIFYRCIPPPSAVASRWVRGRLLAES